MPQSKGPFYDNTAIAYTSHKNKAVISYLWNRSCRQCTRFRRQGELMYFSETGTWQSMIRRWAKAEEAGIHPQELLAMFSNRRFQENLGSWILHMISSSGTTDDYHEKQFIRRFKETLYDQEVQFKGVLWGHVYCTPAMWVHCRLKAMVAESVLIVDVKSSSRLRKLIFLQDEQICQQLIEHILHIRNSSSLFPKKNEMMNNFLLWDQDLSYMSRTSSNGVFQLTLTCSLPAWPGCLPQLYLQYPDMMPRQFFRAYRVLPAETSPYQVRTSDSFNFKQYSTYHTLWHPGEPLTVYLNILGYYRW